MNDLTEKQAAFVAAFTSEPGCIANATKSAIWAGYSEKSAREIGRQQLVKPHIKAAVDEALRDQITGPLASKAVDVLREIVHDKEAPQKLRLEASRTILDRSGIIAPRAAEQKPLGQERALADLSPAELSAFIRQGQESLARKARDAGDGLSVVSG